MTSLMWRSVPVERSRKASVDPYSGRRPRCVESLTGRGRPPGAAAFAAGALARTDESRAARLAAALSVGSSRYATHFPDSRAIRNDRTRGRLVTCPFERSTIANDALGCSAGRRFSRRARSTSLIGAYVIASANLLSAVICAGAATFVVSRAPATICGRPMKPRGRRYSVTPLVARIRRSPSPTCGTSE